ncbi:MAG: undecaprenyl/decaprenyl-phosphate alpha-N-acetylglucosaminyl 1-phosphate transferase [Patescibacteria group bacterium]|nr:undecaprenyl/decaprenyl-phosphate alpha-N-acetylglucosaminyl 1-phosphate transferase [Patescibacteria group bacterium]
MINPLLIIGLSALISYLLTFPTIAIARRFRLVTDISKRFHPAHVHTGIIPRGGGIPIYLTILIMSLLFLPINKIIIGILLGTFLLLIVGLLDDYYDVSPYWRFGANILIAVLVVSCGLGIPYISNPFSKEVIRLDQWVVTFQLFGTHTVLIVANALAVLWLTWIMNMVNWSKGVDGQLPGFVSITALFLGLLSQRFTSHDISTQTVALLSFMVSGAFLGFLPHNFYPQRIMPGYGGGALAGFLLGVLSILSFGKLGTAVLVLAIPTIDAVYVIIRRLKNRKSPFKADWGHFHHRLLEIGWGKRRIALFYWIISLFLGVTSLFLDGYEKAITFLTIGILLIVFIVIIERLKKSKLV